MEQYKVVDEDHVYSIGTNCQICDVFIPIIGMRDAPRICDECKKRLKELLYPKEE